MRKIGFIFFLLSAMPSYAESEVFFQPERQAFGSSVYTLTVKSGNETRSTTVWIAGNPAHARRIIYIFHGFKPAGDPYKQDPSRFIQNWNLPKITDTAPILFVLPDNKDSVYPITKASDPVSDMQMLLCLHNTLTKNKFAGDFICAGFSAGVEGAIKFGSLIDNCTTIIAISGNYQLFDLPAGERAFHEKQFGTDKNQWEKENPLNILTHKKFTIHLFCEEKNAVNVKQAQHLVQARIPGITIIDYRDLGKGHSHNWNFLTSTPVLHKINEIFISNLKK